MKIATTLKLLAAVCLLGCLLWIIDHEDRRNKDRPVAGMKILDARNEDVTSFRVVRPDFEVDFVRRDEGWFISTPVASRANAGEVERILDALERMTAAEVITGEQLATRKLSLTDYGLGKPSAIVDLHTHSRSYSIRFGNPSEIGDFVYISLADSDALYIADSSVTNVIPSNVSSIRDKTLFARDPTRVLKIELSRTEGAFFRLVRNRDGWMLQQPMLEKADDERVSLLLQSLYSLGIRSFVWDAKTEVGKENPAGITPRLDAQVVPYGLSRDDAVANISFWYGENESPVELSIGKEAPDDREAVYAIIHGIPSVFTLSRNCMNLLGANVNELRDRAVFRFRPDNVASITFQQGDHRLVLKRDGKQDWAIAEPIQWKADTLAVQNTLAALTALKINAFMDQQETTDIQKLGLLPGSIIVQISESMPKSPESNDKQTPPPLTTTQILHLGNPTTDGTQLFARREPTNSVFVIPADSASFLLNEPTDALVYCDKTVLSVKPESVRALTLASTNGKQFVSRNEPGGKWTTPLSATNQINSAALDAILTTTATLRADHIVAHGTSGGSTFGLDAPIHVLTLGLSGEAGIRKTLLIGASSAQGCYAQVQGQDIVFVLPPEIVAKLTNGLLVAAPEPPATPPTP